jgi:DUF4097 and DUF4098 domain-containing protein YvlB
MNQPIRWMTNITVLLISVCSVPVYADGTPVDETRPARANGHIEISVVRGELLVRGWNQNEIRVTGELDEQMTEFVFDVEAGNAIIAVRVPKNTGNSCCDEGSNLLMYVPIGSQVNISAVSTDVSVHEVKGGLDVSVVSGDVELQNVHDRVTVVSVTGDVDLHDASGRIRLKSVSGDVYGENIEGPINIHSVSGELTLLDAKGNVDVKTVSGDIEARALGFEEMRISSVSGDIDIDVDGEAAAGGVIECDTISGDIRVRFARSDVSARFDLDTRSGNIKNRFNDVLPVESKYANREKLRMVVSDGDAEVILQSRSGDIVISK